MKKLIFLLPFVAMGCSSSQEVEYEKSTGKINKAKANSRFHINLSEDHKVGSGLWSMMNGHDEKVVSYVNSVYTARDGGSVNFNFEAQEKGKTEIRLCQTFAGDTMQKVAFIVEVE